VAKKHLDLLQLAAGGAAQFRAGASKVMGRDAGDTDFRCVLAEHLPDELFAEQIARDAVATNYWPENTAIRNPAGRCPGVDRHPHPIRHRDGADPAVFANEIDDTPATVARLHVRHCERSNLGPAESAAEKNGEDGTVTEPTERGDIRRVEQHLCLARRWLVSRRMRTDFALFTRAIPAASSGASSPLSAASAASLRIADILMMMDDDPSPRSSSDTRQALTVALVKPGRGAC
jgi:hypothetical protein